MPSIKTKQKMRTSILTQIAFTLSAQSKPADLIYLFLKQQIEDSCKLKEFADDNFKCDENGRKFSKRVENTVEKGGITHYEQFLLFPVFSSLVLQTCKNQGLFGKGLKYQEK